MKNMLALFLVFVLLFVAFNPNALSSRSDFPTFFEIFEFCYTITFGTLDMIVSIFQGPEVLLQKFDIWRTTIFGDITLFDFLNSMLTRSIDFLDSIAERIPVVREIKHVIDEIVLPFENIISDIVDWLTEKLG